MPTPLTHIFHLYNRLGFGISYPEAKVLAEKPLKDVVNGLIVSSTIGNYLNVIQKTDIPARKDMKEEGMNKRDFNQLITQKTQALNAAWMKRLLETKNVLLEKQTLFWHGHFACRIRQPYLMQELNNIHRKLAFGNFRDMLVEVSKSSAMLLFLNNQQNRKQKPNENFARELLELFTLGRGNYTEDDIKEIARAFTGWAFNRDTLTFQFNEKNHDKDEKTIFGRKGKHGGEDVINFILSKKETAYFLTRKMYKFYVSETINENHITELAEFYYINQYNAGALLKKIFTSPWFYEASLIGGNIKSPIEYIIGLSRQFKLKYSDDKLLLRLQRQLGQVLFYPPNVAGWPGGKSFIDQSTLLMRMKLPSVLLNKGKLEYDREMDDPDDFEKYPNVVNENLGVEMNWSELVKPYEKMTFESLCRSFLMRLPDEAVQKTILQSPQNDTKERILQLVSLPEYSLC
jgi:uncharacterized protein (DUF1800 family)